MVLNYKTLDRAAWDIGCSHCLASVGFEWGKPVTMREDKCASSTHG